MLRDGMRPMSVTGESDGVPLPGVDPAKVLYLGLGRTCWSPPTPTT